MKNKKECWNCNKTFESSKKDVILLTDDCDQHYTCLLCPSCGLATPLGYNEPKWWYWDYDKKCMVIPE